MALGLLFGYSLSSVFATVGLAVGDPETAQAAAFPVMAPLVFASSAFVPVETMAGWLQPFAEHQPVSVTASAVRALVIGGPTTSYVLQSLAWSAAILLVFVPAAVRRYRRAAWMPPRWGGAVVAATASGCQDLDGRYDPRWGQPGARGLRGGACPTGPRTGQHGDPRVPFCLP
jgi:ABC-2 family transporter protein